MTSDRKPLRLMAQSREEIDIISAMLQDSLLLVSDIVWSDSRRSLGLNLQRFRWEKAVKEGETSAGERVACSVCIDSVLGVRSRGIDRDNPDQAACLLRLEYCAGDGCGGLLRLLFSGDAEIEATVECINLRIADVSDPWPAAARPRHIGED